MGCWKRIVGMLCWLGVLAVASTIVLAFSSYRVGEHRSSTFGKAYTHFERSWGGEIGVPPPEFLLERTYTEEVYDKAAKQFRKVEKIERIPLIPRAIRLNTNIDYGEQKRGWLTFNAFEATSEDTYRLVNTTSFQGKALLRLKKPARANLMHDYTVQIEPRGETVLRPSKDPLLLSEDFKPGDALELTVRYGTKGMDLYAYNLSEYQHSVVEALTADIRMNTPEFVLYRFGLPHSIDLTEDGAHLHFEVNNFATTQDLGVSFISRSRYLDRVHSLIRCSPVPLVLFLLVIFVYAQVQGVRFHPFHYLFLTVIHVFYFLFVAYLIRFFEIGVTFGLSALMTVAMFLVYAPSALGRRFAFRIAGTYLAVLTMLYSLVFLLPVFRGILFLVLMFLVFLSVMIRVARSDISSWRIVIGPPTPSLPGHRGAAAAAGGP